MKLLRCYVENFGKLSNFEISFTDGVNTINEKNGFGKSTLVAFVKAMFYGLPKSSKRILNENERKKYTPWQGGNFGGNLDFELNSGERYRIERFFEKKERDDTFKLFDMDKGQISYDFSANIGEEIFAVDVDSFERSTYLSERDVNVRMTDSINAKLSNLVEDTNDTNSFDKAITLLKNQKKYYEHDKGNGGEIYRVQNKIDQLNENIFKCESSLKDLKDLSSDIKEKLRKEDEQKQELSSIKSKIKEVYDNKAKTILFNQYKNMKKELEMLEQKHIKLQAEFIKGIPSEEEIFAIYRDIQGIAMQKNMIEQLLREKEDLKEKILKLKNFFTDEVPSILSLNECKEKCYKIEEYNNKLQVLQHFTTEQKKKNKSLFTIAFFFLVIVVGVMLSVKELVMGIAVVFVAIVGSAVSLILLKIQNDKILSARLEEEKILKKNILEKHNEMDAFAKRYFSETCDDVKVQLEHAKDKCKEYVRYKELVKDCCKKVETITNQLKKLQQNVNSFFERYSIKVQGDEYSALEHLKDRISELRAVSQGCKEKKSSLEEFYSCNNIKELTDVVVVDVDELIRQESVLQQQLDVLRDEITQGQIQISKLSESKETLLIYTTQKEKYKAIQAEYKCKKELIEKAKKYIEQARDDLSKRYLDGMRRRFVSYSRNFLSESIGEVSIDTKLNVGFWCFGENKCVDYLSRGYRSVVEICMRFALIDALYENEKPFVILDDPFVNMDDEKLKSAVRLLKEIGERTQVIYLICSSNRHIQPSFFPG